MAGAATKLVGLTVSETSGVDHPAHLTEGWLVMKQAGAVGARQVPGHLVRTGDVMPEPTAAERMAALTKANEELTAKVEALTKALDAAKPHVEPTEDDLVKAAPPAVRTLLEKARKAEADAVAKAAAAEAEVQKAKDLALDAEAVTKAAPFKDLGLEPKEIGPALRQLGLVNADLAKSVEKALTAAKEQVKTASLFKSVGVDGETIRGGNTYGQMLSVAKAAVAAGNAKTVEQAMATIPDTNPELYASYLEEKGR